MFYGRRCWDLLDRTDEQLFSDFRQAHGKGRMFVIESDFFSSTSQGLSVETFGWSLRL